jgi:hypothetical protein
VRTVTVISGPGQGASIEIDREIVIGREAADLTIDDPELSRRHLALRPVERGVELEDLGSRNGTKLNGQHVSGVVIVSTTGTVKAGASELRIDVELAPPTVHRGAPAATPAQASDPTVVRPHPPSATAAPMSAPPTPPPTAPAQAQPPGPPRPRRRGMMIALAAAGVTVAVGVLVLVLTNGGSSTSSHVLNGNLRVGTVDRSSDGLLLAGIQRGTPTGEGAVTLDLTLRPRSSLGTAKQLSSAHWLCFPITQEHLIHCAPPGYLQGHAPDVPLVVFDTKGEVFFGPEDLIRNDVYHGQKCPFEGGGPYHRTPQGYVACHQFLLPAAFRPGYRGTAEQPSRGGWLCFPITAEHLIHCAPPGYLQRRAADVPLLVFDAKGTTFLGTEDLIRNDVYRGQKCPFEGGGPYHRTPKGYVACHQFPLQLIATAREMAFSGLVVQRFDDGSMTSFVQGTVTPGPDGSASYTGTGAFTVATKSYDGAKGRYRLSGTVGRQGNGTFTLTGNAKY